MQFNQSLDKSWPEVWAAMRADNILYADVGDGSLHSLMDIVLFVAMFRKCRRVWRRPVTSNMSSNLLDELCCALFHWLALHMDRFVKDVHMTRSASSIKSPEAVGCSKS